MIKDIIGKNLKKALEKIAVDEEINIEHPDNPAFGDYASNVALKLAKKLKKNPLQIANEITHYFPKDKFISKVEVVKPGFINFWVSDEYFLQILRQISKEKFSFPPYHLGENKKIMVEFAHPNTHKFFHIGHLRNISIGESLVRILEAVGNKVIRANYQGDVGLHIAKCLYQLKKWKIEDRRWKNLEDKINFIGKAYTEGNRAYEEDKKAKEEILKINELIYKQDKKIFSLWQETRKWSLDYFSLIYKRVNSRFDRFYFESECADRGIKICKLAEKKGLLKKSRGALIFDGKPYGLDTRVFINNLGYPTYEGKELALAEKEFSEFGQLDKCIHVVTPEQKSFFQVTFKVEELLDEKKFKGKQYHLAYEWVRLKTGKMSSRLGNTVEAGWLIDQVKKQILEKFKCDKKIAETIAIAAVKYSFLKHDVFSQIAFDFDESISLAGNSGPYLLYTYVRIQSVLKKANHHPNNHLDFGDIYPLKKEEKDLLRSIPLFLEMIYEAAKNLAPNLIANYLFDLAQKYNLFYQKHQILTKKENIKNFRLLLTKATGETINKGLSLLGIETVERM